MENFEDNCVVFEEVDETQYDLWSDTFSNDLCGWITYEVYKKLGDNIKHIAIFPGSGLCLKNPKSHPCPCNVYVIPISEDKVRIESLLLEDQEIILSPEDAVKFIIEL